MLQTFIDMKNIAVIIAFFFVCSLNLIAQEPISYSKVIQTDSVGKDVLFSTIHEWFAMNYNSANDVIQLADKEGGTIVGKGLFSYSLGKLMYNCYDGTISYTIKVTIKDNRYKVDLLNFTHKSCPACNVSCSMGLITTAEQYTASSFDNKAMTKIWVDAKVKIENYANSIFYSLEEKTNSIKTEIIDSNW